MLRKRAFTPTYVDELILRDRDTDVPYGEGDYGGAGSDLDERLYATTDANHNVTALVDPTGAVVQRFVYDPYGQATVLSGSWSPTSDAYAWNYLHQGGRYDAITGLYNFRHRDYSATLGRWISQDPYGYGDGANLFQFLGDNVLNKVDPQGTHTQSDCYATFNKEWSRIAKKYAALQAKNMTPGAVAVGGGIIGTGAVWICTASGPVGWAVGGAFEGLDGILTGVNAAEIHAEMIQEEDSVRDALNNCLASATGP